MAKKKERKLTLLEELGGEEPKSPFASSSYSTTNREEVSESTSPPTPDLSGLELQDVTEEFDNPIQEVGMEAEQVQEAAKNSLDFLAALALPTIFQFCFPPVFLSVWQWLLSYANTPRIFPQLALGLPRGFGKTTLIKIFILYCLLFTKKKFILIICARAALAENIIADIVDMLEEPNILKIFGDWRLGIEKDTQSIKKFGFRGRNIILAGLGSGTSLRGLNMKNERPDIMIFDDVQTKEEAESEVQSTQLEDWMVGTAMKAKSPHGCMFLFIANMYPTKWSILRRLKTNPKWVKFITGGIREDGTSLWEELQPIAQLLDEFENDLAMGKPEIFYSEVLNDENASANNLIDISKLPDVPCEPGDIPAGNFVMIDPATDKLGADEVSIGYFEIHNAAPVLMELEEERFSPGDTIRTALQYCLTHNCRLVVCEANAYQYTFLYWFDFICEQMNISGIECVPIYSGTKSKNARILNMFKQLIAGEIFYHEKVAPNVNMQITGFNPLRRDNTDGLLDLLTYSPRVIQEFGEYVISTNIIEQQEFEAIEVPEFNSPF